MTDGDGLDPLVFLGVRGVTMDFARQESFLRLKPLSGCARRNSIGEFFAPPRTRGSGEHTAASGRQQIGNHLLAL